MRIARVIDYETTDLPEAEAAEIIEVGFYNVDLEAKAVMLESAWQSLACPRGPISPVASAAHHLMEVDVKDAPQMRSIPRSSRS